jgi:predicted nuclease of predicted toxin-antitoxin system
MSKLFATLSLDEDVDVLLADLIKARGFDAATTAAAGRRSTDDAAQLAYATAEGRVLLTHNRADFEALAQQYYETGRPHSGILIAVRRPVYDLARRVLVILDAITADEMQNQTRYI